MLAPMDAPSPPFVHPTAEVGAGTVGAGTRLWHAVQLLGDASVGAGCTVGKGAFLGAGTRVGDRVKIGNGANLFGARVEDEAFLAPLSCLLEDPSPRAVHPDGTSKDTDGFERRPVVVRRGATIGAAAVVLPGVVVGQWAMVAAGSVVHRDVGPYTLVAGNPARAVGLVCRCGRRLGDDRRCPCGLAYQDGDDGLVPAP